MKNAWFMAIPLGIMALICAFIYLTVYQPSEIQASKIAIEYKDIEVAPDKAAPQGVPYHYKIKIVSQGEGDLAYGLQGNIIIVVPKNSQYKLTVFSAGHCVFRFELALDGGVAKPYISDQCLTFRGIPVRPVTVYSREKN